MRRLLLVAGVLAIACSSARAAGLSHPACAAKNLTATFAKIPGSAGGGLVSYRLTVTNRSAATCLVQGIPRLTLLDAQGSSLPTEAGPVTISAFAAKVVLAPGRSAAMTARLSPTYAAPSDAQSGPCQPVAARLRVIPGFDSTNASLAVPIDPPTSVCNRGSMQLTGWKKA